MSAEAEVAQRFARNLTALRKKADLSQEQLSVMASLHRTEISDLERGLRVPRIDTLVKLASSLTVPTEELLEGIDWTPGEVRPGGFRVGAEDEG